MNELMYKQRKANVAAFRGCGFQCTYCAFRDALKRVDCNLCQNFTPHEHLDVLARRPPRTDDGEFLTIGLTGDVAFADDYWYNQVIKYCERWHDRTFLIQTKNPVRLEQFTFPSNVVIGTTIETDVVNWDSREWWKRMDQKIIGYSQISKAPHPYKRLLAMERFKDSNDIAITIEPILDFHPHVMKIWIDILRPKWIWVGYDSKNCQLPEPPLEKTKEFVEWLENNDFDVRLKLIRPAWWEIV